MYLSHGEIQLEKIPLSVLNVGLEVWVLYEDRIDIWDSTQWTIQHSITLNISLKSAVCAFIPDSSTVWIVSNNQFLIGYSTSSRDIVFSHPLKSGVAAIVADHSTARGAFWTLHKQGIICLRNQFGFALQVLAHPSAAAYQRGALTLPPLPILVADPYIPGRVWCAAPVPHASKPQKASEGEVDEGRFSCNIIVMQCMPLPPLISSRHDALLSKINTDIEHLQKEVQETEANSHTLTPSIQIEERKTNLVDKLKRLEHRKILITDYYELQSRLVEACSQNMTVRNITGCVMLDAPSAAENGALGACPSSQYVPISEIKSNPVSACITAYKIASQWRPDMSFGGKDGLLQSAVVANKRVWLAIGHHLYIYESIASGAAPKLYGRFEHGSPSRENIVSLDIMELIIERFDQKVDKLMDLEANMSDINPVHTAQAFIICKTRDNQLSVWDAFHGSHLDRFDLQLLNGQMSLLLRTKTQVPLRIPDLEAAEGDVDPVDVGLAFSLPLTFLIFPSTSLEIQSDQRLLKLGLLLSKEPAETVVVLPVLSSVAEAPMTQDTCYEEVSQEKNDAVFKHASEALDTDQDIGNIEANHDLIKAQPGSSLGDIERVEFNSDPATTNNELVESRSNSESAQPAKVLQKQLFQHTSPLNISSPTVSMSHPKPLPLSPISYRSNWFRSAFAESPSSDLEIQPRKPEADHTHDDERGVSSDEHSQANIYDAVSESSTLSVTRPGERSEPISSQVPSELVLEIRTLMAKVSERLIVPISDGNQISLHSSEVSEEFQEKEASAVHPPSDLLSKDKSNDAASKNENIVCGNIDHTLLLEQPNEQEQIPVYKSNLSKTETKEVSVQCEQHGDSDEVFDYFRELLISICEFTEMVHPEASFGKESREIVEKADGKCKVTKPEIERVKEMVQSLKSKWITSQASNNEAYVSLQTALQEKESLKLSCDLLNDRQCIQKDENLALKEQIAALLAERELDRKIINDLIQEKAKLEENVSLLLDDNETLKNSAAIDKERQKELLDLYERSQDRIKDLEFIVQSHEKFMKTEAQAQESTDTLRELHRAQEELKNLAEQRDILQNQQARLTEELRKERDDNQLKQQSLEAIREQMQINHAHHKTYGVALSEKFEMLKINTKNVKSKLQEMKVVWNEAELAFKSELSSVMSKLVQKYSACENGEGSRILASEVDVLKEQLSVLQKENYSIADSFVKLKQSEAANLSRIQLITNECTNLEKESLIQMEKIREADVLISHLNAECKMLKNSLAEKEELHELELKKIQELHSEDLQKTEESISAMSTQIIALQSKLSEDLSVCSDTKATDNTEVDKMPIETVHSDSIQNLHDELANLRNLVKHQNQQLEVAQEAVLQAEKETLRKIEHIRAEASEATQRDCLAVKEAWSELYDRVVEENTILRSTLEDEKTVLADRDTTIKKLADMLQEQAAASDHVKHQCEKSILISEEKIQELQKKLVEKQQQLDAIQRQTSAANDFIAKLQNDVLSSNTHSATLSQLLAGSKEEATQLSIQIETLKTRIKMLEESTPDPRSRSGLKGGGKVEQSALSHIDGDFLPHLKDNIRKRGPLKGAYAVTDDPYPVNYEDGQLLEKTRDMQKRSSKNQEQVNPTTSHKGDFANDDSKSRSVCRSLCSIVRIMALFIVFLFAFAAIISVTSPSKSSSDSHLFITSGLDALISNSFSRLTRAFEDNTNRSANYNYEAVPKVVSCEIEGGNLAKKLRLELSECQNVFAAEREIWNQDRTLWSQERSMWVSEKANLTNEKHTCWSQQSGWADEKAAWAKESASWITAKGNYEQEISRLEFQVKKVEGELSTCLIERSSKIAEAEVAVRLQRLERESHETALTKVQEFCGLELERSKTRLMQYCEKELAKCKEATDSFNSESEHLNHVSTPQNISSISMSLLHCPKCPMCSICEECIPCTTASPQVLERGLFVAGQVEKTKHDDILLRPYVSVDLMDIMRLSQLGQQEKIRCEMQIRDSEISLQSAEEAHEITKNSSKSFENDLNTCMETRNKLQSDIGALIEVQKTMSEEIATYSAETANLSKQLLEKTEENESSKHTTYASSVWSFLRFNENTSWREVLALSFLNVVFFYSIFPFAKHNDVRKAFISGGLIPAILAAGPAWASLFVWFGFACYSYMCKIYVLAALAAANSVLGFGDTVITLLKSRARASSSNDNVIPSSRYRAASSTYLINSPRLMVKL